MNSWIFIVVFAATLSNYNLAKSVGDEKPTIEKSALNTWSDVTKTTKSSSLKNGELNLESSDGEELDETESEETTEDETTDEEDELASTFTRLGNEDQNDEYGDQQLDSENDNDYDSNTQEIKNGFKFTNNKNYDNVKLNKTSFEETLRKIDLAAKMFKIFIKNEIYGNRSSLSKKGFDNRTNLSNLNNEKASGTVASTNLTEMTFEEDVGKKLAEATLFDYQLFAKFYLQQLYECATADEINVNWTASASDVPHKFKESIN